MFSNIVDGISIKLNSIFGDGYEIYSEDVEQGLTEPCFFIKSLPVQNRRLLGKRKQRTYSFVITYFPKNNNAEMQDVAEKLLDGLEYIILITGEIIRGHSLEAEIVDGLLQFSVQYVVFLNDYENEESMETMESSVGVKGD